MNLSQSIRTWGRALLRMNKNKGGLDKSRICSISLKWKTLCLQNVPESKGIEGFMLFTCNLTTEETDTACFGCQGLIKLLLWYYPEFHWVLTVTGLDGVLNLLLSYTDNFLLVSHKTFNKLFSTHFLFSVVHAFNWMMYLEKWITQITTLKRRHSTPQIPTSIF